MERKYINTTTNSFKLGRATRPVFTSLTLMNSLYLFPIRYFSDYSKLVNSNLHSSKLSDKEQKAEIYKKGFPAVFEYMSKLKNKNYFAITKPWAKPLDFLSLKDVQGI